MKQNEELFNDEFINKYEGIPDLEEVIEKQYNGDIARYTRELTEEIDTRLKELGFENPGEVIEINGDKDEMDNSLEEESEEYGSSTLPREVEEKILRHLKIIEEMEKVEGYKVYSEEETYAYAFGEDYLNGKLSN